MIFRRVSLLMLALVLAACTESTEHVKEAASSYLSARLNGDFITAAAFVDEASQNRLEDLELLVLTESTEGFAGEFDISEVLVDGQKASVVYTLIGYGEDTLDLVKVDGHWKIDLMRPSAVPDAGVLWQDLRELEEADTLMEKEIHALDQMLLEEDSLGDEFDMPVFEEVDTTL